MSTLATRKKEKMIILKKDLFIERATKEANVLMSNPCRKRQLDGRLQLLTLQIVADYLPSNVKFLETKSKGIRQDYFAINTRIKNLHIFNNNTIYIQQYDDMPVTNIIVIKATCKTVYTVKTSEIIDKRLTLKELQAIPSLKVNEKLADKLGLL